MSREYWILRTEEDRFRDKRAELARGNNVYYWTVGSKARRGDLVFIYGMKPAQAFGILGVVLREPQRSVADGHYWSEVLLTRTREPIKAKDLTEDSLRPVVERAGRKGAAERVKEEHSRGRRAALEGAHGRLDARPRHCGRLEAGTNTSSVWRGSFPCKVHPAAAESPGDSDGARPPA